MNGTAELRLGKRRIWAFTRRTRNVASVLLLVLAGCLAATSPASADVPAGGDFSPYFSPSIWSDKADYAPGETVRLSGANWQPGESVHLRVNDDAGSTWSRDVDVTADDAGAIADTFNLPDWFVATYSVTATGASGAVATTSFTDSNVQPVVAPSGYAAQMTLSKFNSNSGCSGTPNSTQSVTVTGSQKNTSMQVAGGESLRLDAADHASGANSDKAFLSWSAMTDLSVIAGTSGMSVCFKGSQGGAVAPTANYSTVANSAPAINRDNALVPVTEGQTATNSGTWSDANSGDTVTLTASRGTVTKFGTNASGTWSWSQATTDGPEDSGTVTITANDGNGGITTTSFNLTVNNVAPTVT